MKTNSLINSIYNRSVIGSPDPVVGMGCTVTSWTDRYPATVSKVEKPKSKVWAFLIEVTYDNYKVVKGSVHDGSAEYEYETNPSGPKGLFAKSIKSGEWRTGKDVEELVKLMRKGGLPFNLFYVPLPEDAEYSITMYAPKVEGALFLGFWGFDE